MELPDLLLHAHHTAGIKARLAPTPSGYLHAGNAINFILNALAAKVSKNGRLLLRIDDMDSARKRPEYVNDIFQTLNWLGIEWQEGPTGPDDFEANWPQMSRLSLYEAFLEKIWRAGGVFLCQKSRKDLEDYNGQYPDIFRHQPITLGDADTCWRAQTPTDFVLPCFVVRRRDGKPAYQVTSLCDDYYFGVTHIIRGIDLYESTIAQHWLADQLGQFDFSRLKTAHHPLLKDEQGYKISKSNGATSVRITHYSASVKAELFQQAAKWLGVSNENIQNLPDLVALYENSII